MDQNCASEMPEFKGETPFELAVEIVNFYPKWIDWDDPTEPLKKPLWAALVLLETRLGEVIPEALPLFLGCLEKITKGLSYGKFCQSYFSLRDKIMRDRTEFITKAELGHHQIREGQVRYYHSKYAFCLIDFLLIHRPCCRLFQVAPLIPAIAAGVPAIPLIA